jgi:2-isopropylmalate synthase
VELVKRREFEGYSYDGAEASFELLARRTFGGVPEFFRVASLRAVDERRWNAEGEFIALSEVATKVEVQGQLQTAVAKGKDLISALDTALRKVLLPAFPVLSRTRLTDYQVRTHARREGAKAMIRVVIHSANIDVPQLGHWSTVGVSGDFIDASLGALLDAITYFLVRAGSASA